jgi:hypothetical protein
MAAAACLLAAALAGCSRSDLPPIAFTPTGQAKDAPDPQAAFEAARAVCQEEARRKGIANVTAIILRRGKSSEKAYVACMEKKGYETAE